VRAITAERQRMSEALRALGWITPLPSETNFVLCRVSGGRDARSVKQAIEKQGVLVRYFDKDGLRDCLRISVGTPAHTDALVRALGAVQADQAETAQPSPPSPLDV
jgi:histidinol-phosphate aminotransferase